MKCFVYLLQLKLIFLVIFVLVRLLLRFVLLFVGFLVEVLQFDERVLESFYLILSNHSLLFAPFIQNLHLSILFIITNLEAAYQKYSDSTQRVVKVISKIQLKLLSILSKQDIKHIFNSCVMLITAVSKIPPLTNLNSVDMCEMIYFITTTLGEEAKIKLLKVPAVTQILRVGLKQIEKSDEEIDEWLSILSDPKEE